MKKILSTFIVAILFISGFCPILNAKASSFHDQSYFQELTSHKANHSDRVGCCNSDKPNSKIILQRCQQEPKNKLIGKTLPLIIGSPFLENQKMSKQRIQKNDLKTVNRSIEGIIQLE